jgi:hypothetical protein
VPRHQGREGSLVVAEGEAVQQQLVRVSPRPSRPNDVVDEAN